MASRRGALQLVPRFQMRDYRVRSRVHWKGANNINHTLKCRQRMLDLGLGGRRECWNETITESIHRPRTNHKLVLKTEFRVHGYWVYHLIL